MGSGTSPKMDSAECSGVGTETPVGTEVVFPTSATFRLSEREVGKGNFFWCVSQGWYHGCVERLAHGCPLIISPG
jgi:hypothetical protein